MYFWWRGEGDSCECRFFHSDSVIIVLGDHLETGNGDTEDGGEGEGQWDDFGASADNSSGHRIEFSLRIFDGVGLDDLVSIDLRRRQCQRFRHGHGPRTRPEIGKSDDFGGCVSCSDVYGQGGCGDSDRGDWEGDGSGFEDGR